MQTCNEKTQTCGPTRCYNVHYVMKKRKLVGRHDAITLRDPIMLKLSTDINC